MYNLKNLPRPQSHTWRLSSSAWKRSKEHHSARPPPPRCWGQATTKDNGFQAIPEKSREIWREGNSSQAEDRTHRRKEVVETDTHAGRLWGAHRKHTEIRNRNPLLNMHFFFPHEVGLAHDTENVLIFDLCWLEDTLFVNSPSYIFNLCSPFCTVLYFTEQKKLLKWKDAKKRLF